MQALFKQKGANLEVGIIAEDEAQDFINTHASILDESMHQVPMSDNMRRRLQRSNYIFSGLKTFHELNEAFPSLLDENGNRKPFEQFLNDVQKIHATYNEHYLRAEYNFVQASATMAEKWEEFQQDAFTLRTMRADFELFNQQLAILNKQESRIFRGYLSGEKDIGDIAEEEGIQYESAAQKVRRAKVKIKIQMVGFLEGIA